MKSRNLNLINNPVSHSSVLDLDAPRPTFHPLSYFILGGVDLSGDELKCDAVVEFDDEESTTAPIVEMDDGSRSYGELYSCALCDPRISHFDIIEQLGAEEAQKHFANNDKVADLPDSDE